MFEVLCHWFFCFIASLNHYWKHEKSEKLCATWIEKSTFSSIYIKQSILLGWNSRLEIKNIGECVFDSEWKSSVRYTNIWRHYFGITHYCEYSGGGCGGSLDGVADAEGCWTLKASSYEGGGRVWPVSVYRGGAGRTETDDNILFLMKFNL